MGGFDGALKQLSIKFQYKKENTWIHVAGEYTELIYVMSKYESQEKFSSEMADAASKIVDYFNNKGKIGFIGRGNISLYCDCT